MSTSPNTAPPVAVRIAGQRWRLAVWFITFVIVAVYLWRFGLVERISEHWPLMTLIAFIGLMISGQLGAGLGLPTLFRDDPDEPLTFFNRLFSRSFLSGFGVMLLVILVWTIIYYLDYINHYDRVRALAPRYQTWSQHFSLLPIIDRDWGMVLAPYPYPSGVYVRFLAIGCLPVLTILALCVVYPTPDLVARRLGGLDPAWARAREFRGYLTGALVAFAFSLLTAAVGYYIGLWFGIGRESHNGKTFLPYMLRYENLHYIFRFYTNLDEAEGKKLVGMNLGAIAVILSVLGLYVEIAYAHRYIMKMTDMSPGLGVCLLFILIALLYFFVMMLVPFLQVVVVGFGVLFLILANSGPFKYRFPGLNLDYKGPIRIDHIDKLIELGCWPPSSDLLNDQEVLDKWRGRFRSEPEGFELRLISSANGMDDIPPEPKSLIIVALVDQVLHIRIFDSNGKEVDEKKLTGRVQRMEDLRKQLENLWPPHELSKDEKAQVIAAVLSIVGHTQKPKLVMVTVSGGAYRASFWTTIVLEQLSRSSGLKGFLNHLRLITGASGGMVGAAYVVALLKNLGPDADPALLKATEKLETDSNRDSLTPIVRWLVRGDMFLAAWPGVQTYDRGRALEDTWPTLKIPFSDLQVGEQEGWLPSLILSPMIVETGRRLLFSNLDLDALTETREIDLRGVSAQPSSSAPNSPIKSGRLYSRSSVEFFRLFPKANKFTINTAIRMNGTFPYISPAINLPTVPPWRVVDAGYYDNYGVNLAMTWAYNNREWIRDHTSGLALIQIRAHSSEVIRKSFRGTPPDEAVGPITAFFRRLATGIQALTSPPQGAGNALAWSMSYRNDEQIRVLSNYFNAECKNGHPDWFKTFIFENPIPFGMNWFITSKEIRRMQESIGDNQPKDPNDQIAFKYNRYQMCLLESWWAS